MTAITSDDFDRTEAFVRWLMAEYPVGDDLQEWAQHDFDHGYPCSPLTEIFAVFRAGGIKIPSEVFDEAMRHFEIHRGSVDAADWRAAFSDIVAD